jgi:archaellum biogenesis ATPase FlaH
MQTQPVFVHIDEIMSYQCETKYIVDPAIPVQTLSVFYGAPGDGKSLSTGDLGTCVARGKAWMGMKTTKTNVLFIDEENGKTRYVRRMRAGFNYHGDLWDLSIAAHISQGFDFTKDDDIRALEKSINSGNYGLVIIDSLSAVCAGGDENSANDMQTIFNNLRRVVEATGAAIILIHHTNKVGSTYRGSTVIKSAPDQLFAVSKGNDIVTITSEKVRDGEPFTFSGRMVFGIDNKGDSTFHMEQVVTVAGKGKRLNSSQTDVINYLFSLPTHEATIDDIKANAVTCGAETMKKSAMALAAATMGYTKRTNTGATGQGVKATYALTQKGIEYAQNNP